MIKSRFGLLRLILGLTLAVLPLVSFQNCSGPDVTRAQLVERSPFTINKLPPVAPAAISKVRDWIVLLDPVAVNERRCRPDSWLFSQEFDLADQSGLMVVNLTPQELQLIEKQELQRPDPCLLGLAPRVPTPSLVNDALSLERDPVEARDPWWAPLDVPAGHPLIARGVSFLQLSHRLVSADRVATWREGLDADLFGLTAERLTQVEGLTSRLSKDPPSTDLAAALRPLKRGAPSVVGSFELSRALLDLEARVQAGSVVLISSVVHGSQCDWMVGHAISRLIERGAVLIAPSDERRPTSPDQVSSPSCWSSQFPALWVVNDDSFAVATHGFPDAAQSGSNATSVVWAGAISWLTNEIKLRGLVEGKTASEIARLARHLTQRMGDRLNIKRLTEALDEFSLKTPIERAQILAEPKYDQTSEIRGLSRLTIESGDEPAVSGGKLKLRARVQQAGRPDVIDPDHLKWTVEPSSAGAVRAGVLTLADDFTGSATVVATLDRGESLPLQGFLPLQVTSRPIVVSRLELSIRADAGPFLKSALGSEFLTVAQSGLLLSSASPPKRVLVRVEGLGTGVGLSDLTRESMVYFRAKSASSGPWIQLTSPWQPDWEKHPAGFEIRAVHGRFDITRTLAWSAKSGSPRGPATASTAASVRTQSTVMAQATPAPFDPGPNPLVAINWRVSRGWVEVREVKVINQATNAERIYAPSEYTASLQVYFGPPAPAETRVQFGTTFLKTVGLGVGNYELVVRSSRPLENQVMNVVGPFFHNPSQPIPLPSRLRPNGIGPATFVEPFLNKAPTGACTVPSERNRSPFASGNGTALAPYVICTPTQFLEMMRMVIDKTTLSGNSPVFRMRDHLDLSSFSNYEIGPPPVNGTPVAISQTCHTIVLEGNGYTIRGLQQTRPNEDGVGLFRCLSGRISFLTLINPRVEGRDEVGAFAGRFLGAASNLRVHITDPALRLRGRSQVGGFFGSSSSSSIFESGVSRFRIEGTGDEVGGLVGRPNCVHIERSFVFDTQIRHDGAIAPDSGRLYGGLTGGSAATAVRSSFDGVVEGNRNICGLGASQATDVRVTGRVRALSSDATGMACAEMDLATNAMQASDDQVAAGGSHFSVEAEVFAPSRVAGLFLLGDYRKGFVLQGARLRSPMSSNNGPRAVAALEVVDDYVDTAAAFGVTREQYETFYIFSSLYDRPPVEANVPEIRQITRISATASPVVQTDYDHPGINAVNLPTGTLQVNLSGVPTGQSATTSLSVMVSGPAVASYRFKVGSAAQIDCAEPLGYSVSQPISAPLVASITSQPDGLIRLCVLARNSSGTEQRLTQATQATWAKDTATPMITRIPASGRIRALSVGATSTVSSGDETKVSLFKYKVGSAASTVCAERWDYSPPVSDPAIPEQAARALDFDLIRTCILPIDEAGNEATAPIESVSHRLGLKPRLEVHGLPAARTSADRFELAFGGDNISSLMFKSGPAETTNCQDLAGYQGPIMIQSVLPLELTRHSEATEAICFRPRSAGGDWLPASEAVRFEVARGAPRLKPRLLAPVQRRTRLNRVLVPLNAEDAVGYSWTVQNGESAECRREIPAERKATGDQSPLAIDLGDAPGPRTICIWTRGENGDWLADTDALQLKIEVDREGPLLQLNRGPSQSIQLSSNEPLQRVRWTYGSRNTACPAPHLYQFNGSREELSRASAPTEGTICAIGQDEAGNWTLPDQAARLD